MGIFCDGADVLNAIWYACEGKTKEALTSALCALPGLGMGIGSLMEKTSRFAQAGKTVKYLSRMAQGGMGVVAGISMAKTGFTNILNGLESGNLSGWDIVTFIGGIAITGLSGRNLAISGRGLAGMMDDAGKVAKAGKGQNAVSEGGTPTSRPTWRQSELDAAMDFPDYDAQKSFINGEEVPYGTKGSVRPDYYKDGFSVDVKNYNVESANGRSNLARNIEKQYYQRIQNLPEGTKQSVLIDIRGQNVSDADLNALYDAIMQRTNNGVEILFKVD